jgi:hypothetical protein
MASRLGAASLSSVLLLGCSDRVELGSDLLWSADTESADLTQWAADPEQASLLPSADTSIEATSDARHSGQHALKLVNPVDWVNEETGPELLHDAGPLEDAYYSAWFLLPEDYRLGAPLTLFHLRSRDPISEELHNGELLQLRSLAAGGYVLQVFNNNAQFLLEPLPEQAPRVDAGRWFQLEARYQKQTGGRLRVWLDGVLRYDLEGRPGATGSSVVLGVCNVTGNAKPAPLQVFVDDAAISATRIAPDGHLSFD